MGIYNEFNKASCAIRSFDSGEPSQMIAHGGAGIGVHATNTITSVPAAKVDGLDI